MPLTNKANPPAVRRACGNCGRLGHLRTTCTKPPGAIAKIGVEVEGYYRDLPAVQRVARNVGCHAGLRDGSLNYNVEGCTPWEFPTAPGTLGEVIKAVTAVYPDATDAKAGMHVHVSFVHPLAMSALACQEFFDYYQASWREWGLRFGVNRASEFWKRLQGENDYCKPNTLDDFSGSDIRTRGRYLQLNFSAWTEHRTVESRLLPMFRDMRIGLAAIEHTVELFETWLAPDGPGSEIADVRVDAEDMPSVTGISESWPVEIAASAVAPVAADVTIDEVPALALTYPEVAPGMQRIPGRRALRNYLVAQELA